MPPLCAQTEAAAAKRGSEAALAQQKNFSKFRGSDLDDGTDSVIRAYREAACFLGDLAWVGLYPCVAGKKAEVSDLCRS